MNHDSISPLGEPDPFVRRAVIATKIALAGIIATAVIWKAMPVLFLLFGAFLWGVFLTSLSSFVSRRTRLPYAGSLTIVVVAILAALAALGYFVVPSIAAQIDELTARVPTALDKGRGVLERYGWGRELLTHTEPKQLVVSGQAILSRTGGALSWSLGYIANTAIVFFVGLYGAIAPERYKRGALRLFPKARRARIGQVFDRVFDTLQWWLVGKFIGMSIIGVLTTIGLWLIDVPLALTLGIIAALMTFVPNIGPALSVIPALMIGFTIGLDKVAAILLVFFGIQAVETYLITPIVQVKTIALPPALTMSMQVILGVLFGGAGIALATPMTAAGAVIVQLLYVEDTLGDRESVAS